MKKILIMAVAQLLMGIVAYAQLEIETTVPTGFEEAINVGVGTGHFETIVKNKSGVETITGIKVTSLGGWEGLEILTNATYEYRGTVYSASVTGDLIQTTSSLPLYAGEQITFKYEKRAACEMVPDASSGYSVQVVDEISVLGTSYSGQSNSYPVLFPGLSVVVPESPDNNVDVEYLENYTDEVVIRNEQNSGKVSSLIIRMEYNNQVVSVNKIEIRGVSGKIEREIISDDMEILLESIDFVRLGFSDGVMPSNSQLQMIVSGRVEKYAATTQVRYSVDYKTFDISCKRLKNAEGVKYFNQTAPNPQMEVDIAVVQKGDLCGRQIIFDAVCRNNASKYPENSILDGYIDITTSNIIIEKVEIGEWVLSKTSRGYELPQNEANQFSELKGGDSIVFRVYAKLRQGSSYNRTGLYFYFYGQDVSGKSLSTYRQTNDQIYDVQAAIEGPGTLDIRKLPQGIYTCSCEAKKIPIEGTMLLDYDVWAYVGERPIRKLSFDQYGKTSENFETVIRACQEDEIRLRMVVKSEGCSEYQVLGQAKANVVQRCWDGELEYEEYYMSGYDDVSEEGGGESADSLGMEDEDDSGGGQSARKKICANIYTDTTMLGSKRATLCESVSIDSKAIVTYNCSDTKCSPPKIMAVEIFDFNQQIDDFFVEDITINNYRAIFLRYTKEPYAKFYQYDYSSKCGQGNDEVIDTLHIKTRIKMPANHLETPRKDANIQLGVGYIDNSVIKISPYTWGEELSVFDAVPTFSSTVDLGHCGRCEVGVELPKTDYEGASGIIINKIEFPGFEDSYYPNSSINSPATVVTKDHVIQGKIKNYKTSIYPKCPKDGYNPQRQGVMVWYTDLADIPTCKRDTVVTVNVSMYDMEYQSPIICLYPTERQQAIGSTTTWTVRVINEGSYKAEQVMLKFTINPENTMALYVEDFMLGTEFIDNHHEYGNSYYVPIGTLNKGEEKDVKISVSYGKCVDEGICTIDVESAWSCEELSPDNFDDFNCGGMTVLELENMVAVLNAVETYSKEYYNLCENIPIHLNISNIGRADLNQLGFWFDEIPSVYSVTDDEISCSYEGEVTNITNISSVPANNTTVSQNILNKNYGVFNAGSNIDIDFNVQMHCGSNQYQVDTLKFNVQSYTNCGDKQKKVFQFIPKLIGFDFLDSISVLSSTTGFVDYKGDAEVLVSITNTSDVLIDSAYISVLLPNGFQYIDYTSLDASIITGISQTPQKDGTLLLQWELQQGRHLAAHETVDIRFRIRAIADCAKDATLLAMCTLKRQMVDCDGNICKVAQSTEAQRVLLQPMRKDLTPRLIGLDSVCAGTPIVYSVEGTGIRNIFWSLSDENTQIDSEYGNSVRIIFPQGKTTTMITANVESECESDTLRKTISVSDVPNILLVDTINIKWKSLNTVLDSLYTIGKWANSPLLIEGCGDYYETIGKENQCGMASKNVVLRITDCCDTVSVGDIVETELRGITTYDVFLLRYYINHKNALQQTTEADYQLNMQNEVCDEKIVPLKECFENRADMNKDGIIDESDIELLQKLIK